MSIVNKEYITHELNPFLKEILGILLVKKPDEPMSFLMK